MNVSAARNRRQILPMALFLRRRWALGTFHAGVGVIADGLPSSLYPDSRRTVSSIRTRRFSSSRSAANPTPTSSFRWLNLEGAGLSMVERLTLEEALLKNTRDNWIIVGRHAVWPPKHITIPHRKSFGDDSATTDNDKQHKHFLSKTIPGYIEGQRPNLQGMIVMGIGGKAQKLLNSRNVIDDQLLVVKRFSGGGTVVMDENAVWTTLIAGRRGTKEEEEDQDSIGHKNNILCKPYPRDIMKWTAEAVFGPAFDVLNANQTMRTTTTHSNNSSNDNNSNGDSNRLPRFSLREDDYVLTFGGDDDNREIRKMGGNAQAITGRQGWLHHTSFLWDYKDSNMERYLKLPEKRPNYRVDRSHKEFLVKLKEHYANEEGPSAFLEAMKEACQESLGLRETDWPSVYQEVFGGSDAEMNAWWLENRTRIQHEL